MTRPTARVLALLEILQAGGTRTASDLAVRLEVDERTVRRYVDHLIDLDIPVRSVRGRYGGYRLTPGYRIPPLMLTDDEALAVLLGLVAGLRAGLVTTSATAMENAAAKIRRVLPEALGRRLDALLATADFTTAARPGATQETGVLVMLAEAARRRRPVAVSYTARDGRRSERTVHPYGIVVHSGRWYVTGADSASGEVRTFRLDRIETATVLPGSFDIPAGFDSAARVLSGLAEVPYQHEVSLRILATAEQVRARLPAGIATVQEIPANPAEPSQSRADSGARESRGWVRVRLRAERLEWIPSLLAWLDRPFVIEYPDALRDHVHALAGRLTASAEGPGAVLPS
jgi:predicted DNA-binding transcriptional regulator YafY